MTPSTRTRLEALRDHLADIDLDEADLGDELLYAYEELGRILREVA